MSSGRRSERSGASMAYDHVRKLLPLKSGRVSTTIHANTTLRPPPPPSPGYTVSFHVKNCTDLVIFVLLLCIPDCPASALHRDGYCLRVVYTPTMAQPMTAEAKASLIKNFELESKYRLYLRSFESSLICPVEARRQKLRGMAAAQCASLRSRLERRVNRVPASKREVLLVDLLAPPPPTPAPAPPAKSVPTKAAPTKASAKTAPVSAPAPAPAPATRRPRSALATASQKAVSKSTTTTSKPTSAKDTKSARAKKRGSDEISNEDKENAAELEVSKKRVRAATLKQPAVTKPASTGRATRAASRKTAPASANQVLSPKNSNTKQKPATRSVRPR
jgi:hypothetical protein